jgi:hypothetical protein
MIKLFIRRHQYLIIFLVGLLLISIITGIICYFNEPDTVLNSLNANLSNLKEQLLNNHLANLLPHLISILLIIVLSFTIVGYLGALFYFFYEGMSIGFTLAYLIKNMALKGLIFGIIYNFVFKLVYIILLIFILIKLYDLVRNIIGLVFYKNNVNLLANFKHNYYSLIIITSIIIGNELFLLLISNFMIKLLINVL